MYGPESELEGNRAIPTPSPSPATRKGYISYGRCLNLTHRLLSSSFWGLPYRILNKNHKNELLRSLWVNIPTFLTKLTTRRNQGQKPRQLCPWTLTREASTVPRPRCTILRFFRNFLVKPRPHKPQTPKP